MKLLVALVFCLLATSTIAQEADKGYQFETLIDLPTTSVKDQHRSGTCWSFSGLSFLESEMLRLGKDSIDLSEMFVVRQCYSDKAVKYVRLHGALNFGPGGAFEDVLYVFKKYGLVPEAAYAGLNYGQDSHVHGEMDAVLKQYVDGVLKNPNKELSTAWHKGFDGILDAYLGQLPETFEVEGKSYTPKSYASEVVGLNPADYIQVTSYSHHPFYEPFIVEVPDNWLWGEAYNLPLNEFKQVWDNALNEGYSIAWAADVSEKGFSFKNGVAIVPETDEKELSGTERSRWEGLTAEEKQKKLYGFDGPIQEKVITQDLRQKEFDTYKTTDDHGMHITGKVKDQNGKVYYTVKNSWNTNNVYEGYFYVSEAFVLFKTMSVMIHKDALPKDIKKKLHLK